MYVEPFNFTIAIKKLFVIEVILQKQVGPLNNILYRLNELLLEILYFATDSHGWPMRVQIYFAFVALAVYYKCLS